MLLYDQECDLVYCYTDKFKQTLTIAQGNNKKKSLYWEI